jgi:hypothetical protein
MTKFETYHETLFSAIDEVKTYCAKAKADCYWPDFDNHFAVGFCLYGGQSARASFPLVALRGRATKNGLHINLYRLESGRYELNVYIA